MLCSEEQGDMSLHEALLSKGSSRSGDIARILYAEIKRRTSFEFCYPILCRGEVEDWQRGVERRLARHH